MRSNTTRKSNIAIYLDTNVIYSSKWCEFIRSEVANLLTTHSNHQNLQIEWYLPELALEERVFRHNITAQKHAESVELLSALLPLPHTINRDMLLKTVRDHALQECKEKGLTVLPTPTSLDWTDIVNRAVNRKPPFDPDPNKEKGFRDAVICEVFHEHAKGLAESAIAIFSSDDSLVQATCAEFDLACKVRYAKNADEIAEHLAELSSFATEQHMAAAKALAKSKFFTKSEPECYYRLWDIIGQINAHVDFLSAKLSGPPSLESEVSRKRYIAPPTLAEVEGSTYHWKSVVTAKVTTVAKEAPMSDFSRAILNLPSSTQLKRHEYEVGFRVSWSFVYHEDDIISSPTFGSIEIIRDDITKALDERERANRQLIESLLQSWSKNRSISEASQGTEDTGGPET